MDPMEFINKLGWVPPRIMAVLERNLRKIPYVQEKIQGEYDGIMGDLENSLKPYREDFLTFSEIPAEGRGKEKILAEMQSLHDLEASKWQDGFVSGAVYHGDQEHIDFLNKVYALNSQSNPLHSDLWPSAAKFEAEIIAMTANMLGAEDNPDPKKAICGTVSSGGTESILLAMKTYRDFARDKKGIRRPEMIVPTTVHAAFDKASQYFGIKRIRIPVDENFCADVIATKKAVTRNAIVIVGSAPAFPHGTVDPIEELSELAYKRGIGFHTDACLGGFVLPWAKKLGYDVPTFDFSLRGVTSISADTHKYGYAAKGTSVVLYRGEELRHYQFYTSTEWPGGLYFSPTLAGSRPGALSAACWASMLTMGADGYTQAAKKIMETAAIIRKGVDEIPELSVLGNPLFVIAFGSDTVNVLRVLDYMTKQGWSLNGLHKPSAVHICVTLRHTQPEVAEKFIEDLQAGVTFVRENPDEEGSMAPIYGMGSSLPLRGVVSDMLKKYLDLLYKI